MNNWFVFFVVAALGLSPVAGPAQGAATDSAVIARILDSARVMGLPQTPLRSLLAEGKQRNHSQARIAAAMRRYYEALRTSRTALGARSTDAEIDAGASVLLSGADAKSLRAVRAARPDANVTVALVVLADLVDRGVPLTRAEDAIVTLAHAGASDAALHIFRTGVQQDLASGQGAESSLLKRTRETVSRLDVVVPRRPPPVELEHVRLIASGGHSSALRQEATALATEPRLQQRAFWDVGVRATPFAALPALQLRSLVAGTFDRAGETGQTSAEFIAALGARRATRGAELGLGATVSSRLAPRLPMAYAALWAAPGRIALRFEGRLAPARSRNTGVAIPAEPLEALGQIAFQTSDTLPTGPGGGNPPPPPLPPVDSGARRSAKVLSRVAEMRMGVSREVLGLTVDVSTGLRFLDARPLDTWSTGSVSARAHRTVALVAGVATRRQILDPSLPARSSVFFGVRMHRTPFVTEDRGAGAAAPRTGAPVGSVEVSEGVTRFEVLAKGAELVEVTGDFTDWHSVAMVAFADDRWRVVLPRAASIVRLRIRIDGGAWMVPAGVARARDAFGEEVGVLVLPATSEP